MTSVPALAHWMVPHGAKHRKTIGPPKKREIQFDTRQMYAHVDIWTAPQILNIENDQAAIEMHW